MKHRHGSLLGLAGAIVLAVGMVSACASGDVTGTAAADPAALSSAAGSPTDAGESGGASTPGGSAAAGSPSGSRDAGSSNAATGPDAADPAESTSDNNTAGSNTTSSGSTGSDSTGSDSTGIGGRGGSDPTGSPGQAGSTSPGDNEDNEDMDASADGDMKHDDDACPGPTIITNQFSDTAWTRCFDGGYVVAGQDFYDQPTNRPYDGTLGIFKQTPDGLTMVTAGSDFDGIAAAFPDENFSDLLLDYLHYPTAAVSDAPEQFSTPSGNIHCHVLGLGAACSIDTSTAALPDDVISAGACGGGHLDGGATLSDRGGGLVVEGPAVGDYFCKAHGIDRDAAALGYGAFTQVGEMICDSRPTGVTCTSQTTWHGFHLSKASHDLF